MTSNDPESKVTKAFPLGKYFQKHNNQVLSKIQDTIIPGHPSSKIRCRLGPQNQPIPGFPEKAGSVRFGRIFR